MEAKDIVLFSLAMLAILLAGYSAWHTYRRNARWTRHFNLEEGWEPGELDLKSLVLKLDEESRQAFDNGLVLTAQRADEMMRVEHWLLKLFERPNEELSNFCQFYEFVPVAIKGRLIEAIDHHSSTRARVPILSPFLIRLLQDSWTAASSQFHCQAIRPGHVLFALFSEASLCDYIRRVVPEFVCVSSDSLRTILNANPSEDL